MLRPVLRCYEKTSAVVSVTMVVKHCLKHLNLLLGKLRKRKENFLRKTPKEKWEIVFNVGSKMFRLLGIEVFLGIKNRWYSYIGAILIFDYIFLISYTLWYYFRKNEYLKGLECTYTAGTVALVGIRDL